MNCAWLKSRQSKRKQKSAFLIGGLRLKVGKFDENTDNFYSYITKFELMMESQRVPDHLKCLHLIANLTGKSLDVVNRMSSVDRNNYGKVKREIMEYFHFTEEGYKKQFRSARPSKDKRPQTVCREDEGVF